MATAFSCVARGGPADYVFVPAVEFREHEIDFKYGSAVSASESGTQAASVGLGYGATPWWFSEFYVKYKHEEGRTYFDAFEWENKFQLTETGKYPVDIGWIFELERPQSRAEGYELKLGPLLQKEFGRMQLNANVLVQRVFDSQNSNATELGYQWQVKDRWRQELEWGAQGFGEMGNWAHWAPSAQQSHRWGPAVFGKFPLQGRQAIRYNASLLFGLTSGSPNYSFRLQLEYEF